MTKAVENRHGLDPHDAPSRPIDLVHLARQSMGDSQLEWEILQMFDQIAKNYLDRLRAERLGETAAINLHALKGAAMGVGASAIAAQARAGEQECRTKGGLCAETFADLEVAVTEARTFIAEVIGSKAP